MNDDLTALMANGLPPSKEETPIATTHVMSPQEIFETRGNGIVDGLVVNKELYANYLDYVKKFDKLRRLAEELAACLKQMGYGGINMLTEKIPLEKMPPDEMFTEKSRWSK